MTYLVKHNGVWKTPDRVFVNVVGTWKEVNQIFINDKGIWKEVYAACTLPSTIGNFGCGGYYAGDISYNGTTYAILVAPASEGEISSLEWSRDDNRELGCTDNYDGLSSTQCLIDNDPYPSDDDIGTWAQTVNPINGYDDWYVPAIEELKLLKDNMYNADLSGTDWDNDGEKFLTSSGYYGNYWSSTEKTDYFAWMVDLNNNAVFEDNKVAEFNCRVVRRVEYWP